MQIAPLLHVGRGVTAIIGGGGKTTLMETLAGELSKKGKVIITTTTHIYRPEQYETLLDADEAAVSAALERSGIVCVASQAESGKLCAPWLSMGTLAQPAESGACYFLYLNDLTISYLRCRFARDLLSLRNLRLLWILADLLVPARAALLRSPHL